jgi:beta-glucuronidase
MKRKLFLLLMCICASVYADNRIPLLSNIYARHVTSLNGDWNYIVDVQENGYYDYRMQPLDNGFFQNRKMENPSDLVEYDFDKAPTMPIPSDWNTRDSRLFFYEGTVWFKRSFHYTPQVGKRAILYFGAVNYDAIIFVNGKRIGRHIGGFTPFNYDVTDILHDGDNFVIVKVDNKRAQDNVPTRIFDWWNYGGITRDVMLAEVNESYVEDYYLQLAKGNTKQIQGWIKLNSNEAGHHVTLMIPELKIRKDFVTDATGKTAFTLKTKPQLWSPEQPKLYDVRIIEGGDTIRDDIGFRTIETRGKKIFLNGKQIFLRGVSIHEEDPIRHGRANNAEQADTLLSWAKQLGCNYVRLAHYPHNEHAVREAEKMGIMVWSEIPVYWTISWDNADTYANAQAQLHDMIYRDKNRANVIIWSIANETPHNEARDKFLGNLATYARQQDSTRLISMAMEVLSASNYVNRLDDNMNKFVDVISFNEYIGWYRDVHDAPHMKWIIPYNKPVIISEFGGGALSGLHGTKEQRWTEEFQAELYRQNLAMLEKIDGLAGLSPWILMDFRSPRRQLTGIQDYFNRKGLISSEGKKKAAFYVMKDWYKKQASK